MMMIKDEMGNRMKGYEGVANLVLTPRMPLIVRVDGKSFHQYTKGLRKPFDQDIIDAMVIAASLTAKEMGGFKLAYTQSDEATFLLTDFDQLTTQGWFRYEANKINSITASMFTLHFNRFMEDAGIIRSAFFDCRCFVMPRDDVANMFLWRQKDWVRNSIQMFAQAHFTHHELNGKKLPDIHEMCHGIGVNWAHLTDQQKNGTYVLRDGFTVTHILPSYENISALVDQQIARSSS